MHAAVRRDDATAFYGAMLEVMVATSDRPCTQSVTTGASLRLAIGDVDGALGCLREAYENGTLVSTTSLFSPGWDPVRHDPRFQAILEGMKLTPTALGAI